MAGKPMEKMAIDIALLPPDDVMDRAIAVNRSLPTQPPEIRLGKKIRLPHLTLMQAVIAHEHLSEVKRILQEAALHLPISLRASLTTTEDGTYFQITESDTLQELHEKIMNKCLPLVSFNPKVEYFDDSSVREETVNFVRDYRDKYAFDKFDPHITLGVGQHLDPGEQFEFSVRRLAVCHLGNYNTCKSILFEFKAIN